MRTPILAVTLLFAASPALAADKAPKPAKGSPEEVVCHREDVTGSLAQSRKRCLTRAQWQGEAERTQAEAGRQEEAGRINSQAPQ